MKHFVVGFAFSEDRERVVLLQKVAKPGEEWQAGKYNGVGGKIELGELEIDAMIREYAEEAGVVHPHWTMFAEWRATNYTLYFFKAFSDRLVEESRTMEQEPVVKAYVTGVLSSDHILPNLKFLIPLALNDDATFTQISSKARNPAFD